LIHGWRKAGRARPSTILEKFVNSQMPTEIKNLKKTAQRILRAVKNKEKIILYGDADFDGISSVIILKETIKNLGGNIIAVYFPDRETEGYGLNEDALNYLKSQAPALLIVLDCGIGNFEEAKLAKKLGFEVIIIDHHEPLNKLPQASIIVNPKQKGDKYPFKDFATAGVIFKLTELSFKEKLSTSLRNNFLELTALATIADMMPQIADNAKFLRQGLSSLKTTFRPGLKIFPETPQKIISACHAGGNQDHLNECYLLLTANSTKEAQALAEKLLEKAQARRLKIQEITEEIEERLLKKSGNSIIFEGDKNWPVLMLGPAASKIYQIHKNPVFLYSQKKDYCQGAVRTPAGIDGVKAMIHCSKFLETYGGHPQAAGFKIKKENLEKFKECLIKYRVFAEQKRR